MGDNVPVILRADRNTRSLGRLPGSSLGDRVVDLPLIGRDFFLVPNTLIVIPLVPPSDLHARVPASFEFFEPVVGLGVIPLKCCGLGFGDAPGALFCHTFSPHMFMTAIQRPSRSLKYFRHQSGPEYPVVRIPDPAINPIPIFLLPSE